VASKNEDIKNKIQNAAEDKFRSYELETQLLAYVVRKEPKHAISIESEWFVNEIYQKVVDVLRESRAIMSFELLTHSIEDRGLVGDEDELLEDTIIDIYDEEIDDYDDHTFRALLKQIVKMYDSRKLFNAMADVVTNMDKFDLEKDRSTLQKATAPTAMYDQRHGGFYVDDYKERKAIMEERALRRENSDSYSNGVPTGIDLFDKNIGGIMPSEFAVIAGRTGLGKTAALMYHALHSWKSGFNTLFVSGEMNKHDLQYRIDSSLTAIPSKLFRLSELSPEHYQRWDNTIQELNAVYDDSYLYIRSYSRGFTVEDIEREVHWLHDETGKTVHTICMDYLNIMKPKGSNGKKGSREWSAQADVVWEFKDLCIDFNLAGYTANQIIDDAFKKRFLTTGDLKYARAISEAAPIIFGLTQVDEDKLLNRMVYQLIKARSAEPPKPVFLNPNMNIMRIHNQLMYSVKSLADIKPQTIDIDKMQSKKSKRKRIREVE